MRTKKLPRSSIIILAGFVCAFLIFEVYDRLTKEERFARELQIAESLVANRGLAPTDYKAWLKWSINRKIGADAAARGSNVRKVVFDEGDPTRPIVYLNADTGSSTQNMQTQMLKDAVRAFGEMFADERASFATLQFVGPQRTIFGTARFKNILIIELNRERADTISWNTVTWRELPKYVNYIFQSEELSEE